MCPSESGKMYPGTGRNGGNVELAVRRVLHLERIRKNRPPEEPPLFRTMSGLIRSPIKGNEHSRGAHRDRFLMAPQPTLFSLFLLGNSSLFYRLLRDFKGGLLCFKDRIQYFLQEFCFLYCKDLTLIRFFTSLFKKIK